VLRKVHRWIGIILALPLIMQALTGCLLIVLPLLTSSRPQIDSTAPPRSIEQQISAARPSAPPGMLPLRYGPPRWTGDSAIVTFGPAGERHPGFVVMVDPASATVTGIRSSNAVFRFLHNLHANLLLPFGNVAIGIMGVFLFAMAMTGVILWWPKPHLWRSGKWVRATLVSRKARGLRLWREAHLSIGFWTCLMLSFLAFSGAMMALPFGASLFGVHHSAPVQQHEHGGRGHHDGAPAEPGETGIDDALHAVESKLPGITLMEAQLGPRPQMQAFQVTLPEYGPNRPAVVRYDARSDSIQYTRDPRNVGTGPLLYQWMHTLHEAKLSAPSWLAPTWKALVFLTGAALFFFTISGLAMWLLRRRQKQTSRARLTVVQPVGAE